jgi:alpha-tubulin suppressor-like RCC1 family protein
MSIARRDQIKLSERSKRAAMGGAARLASSIFVGAFALGASSCGGDGLAPPDHSTVEVASISIDVGSFSIERGFHRSLTATVKDKNGKAITVPLAWRSNDDKVATFEPNGRLAAVDTGTTTITASSLGVTSQPIGVQVVFASAAKIANFQWTPPKAASPGGVVSDSIRVQATNRAGGPAAGTIVKFAITGGGGSLSVTTAIAGQNGVAATRWTLGPALGPNSVTATVVNDDALPIAWVTDNPAKFSVTTYKPMSVVEGDAQTGQILDALPVPPSVKLVDSTGKARVGVPLTFIATNGGRVATTTVSTGADGIASPGTWTLGDIPGDQTLIVRVESATLSLLAHATGTPIHYQPARVVGGGFSTCAIGTDELVSCWGPQPQVGDGDTAVKLVPTPTSGGVHFKTLAGSVTLFGASVATGHFCGVSVDAAIYCWGVNALADTSGVHPVLSTPTRLASNIAWSQATLGLSHVCALTVDHVAYCWGRNASGQLGNRDTLTTFVPSLVYGGFSFSTIASGSSHMCGLTADGTALCWGFNGQGQLGDGTTTNRASPTIVNGGVSFQSIGGGDSWSCGLSKTGQAYCWGAPQGLPAALTPHLYSAAPVFTSLTVGGFHACGLTADGTPYCWGGNQFGQLGDSTQTTRADPTPVAGGVKFRSISAGFFHTCGQTTDGSVMCWGLNSAGELGEKPSVSGPFRTVPRYIVLGVTP